MPDTPSPKHGLVRPADNDFINTWPLSARQLIDALDALVASISLADPRPAAGKSGRIHRHPVTGELSLDNGASWEGLSKNPHAANHNEGGSDPLPGQVPIGGVIPYAGTTLPAGGNWDWADGGLIVAADYPTFTSRVGHAYNGGVDPGGGMIRKPDKRGRHLLGANNFGAGSGGSGNDRSQAARGSALVNGASPGEVSHVITSGELASHSHSLVAAGTHSHGGADTYAGDHSHIFQSYWVPGSGPNGWNFVQGANASGQFTPWSLGGAFASLGGTSVSGGHQHGINADGSHTHGVNNTGSGTAHNNMPPGEADNVIVRIR